jgi:hypothetical protein
VAEKMHPECKSLPPAASFIGAYVPYETPETFSLASATEEREFIEASIKGVQISKQVAALEAQLDLELLDTGGQ